LEYLSLEEFLRFFVVTLKKVQKEWFDSDGTCDRRVCILDVGKDDRRVKIFSGFSFVPFCQALLHRPLGETFKVAEIESFIFVQFSCYCTMSVMLGDNDGNDSEELICKLKFLTEQIFSLRTMS
jgi:hypothetical protein